MKKAIVIITISLSIILTGCTPTQQKSENSSFADQITNSLVYIDVTSNEYSQLYPWRRLDLMQSSGYGCAVAPDQILTTAGNVLDAQYIKVKWANQTEYVQAEIKFIDYEANLCLLQLNQENIKAPLTPVKFSNAYVKDAELNSYCISRQGTLITGRAYLDTAKVRSCSTSYTEILNFIASNSSSIGASAKLYCMNDKPIGIACKSNDDETQLIPAQTINAFLDDCADDNYAGFGSIGFVTEQLIDPAVRDYLKLPADAEGMLVSSVFSLGTGSKVLQPNDIILAIDSHNLNSYGRYEDPKFGQIMYHHLITSKPKGQTITFGIWRNGTEQTIETDVKNFAVTDMMIPYYSFGTKPEFVIIGGYVFQQLTAPYIRTFEDTQNAVPPHIYNYYQQDAFNPTPDKTGIVVLSFALPAEMNLGYQNLSRLVVDTFNGQKISTISDIIAAKKLNPDDKYDIVEFEQIHPTLVINRTQAKLTAPILQQQYGVTSLSNTN